MAGVIVAIAGPGAPASALTVELMDVAADRIERQRAAAEGALPLPGTPNLSAFGERLAEISVKLGAPLFIRAFKAESELEVWLLKDHRYLRFATYPVCQWSGTIGPKVRENDKQTPEGFYSVTKRQLHRSGRHPRSLNLGFPNALDKSLTRTGSYILVHGGCASVGCFAMTDTINDEIWRLAEAALKEGQVHIPVHVFPFRMTQDNLARHQTSEWKDFWLNLKDGYDAFERTKYPPHVSVCDRRYHYQDIAPADAGEAGASGRLRREARRLPHPGGIQRSCMSVAADQLPSHSYAEAESTATKSGGRRKAKRNYSRPGDAGPGTSTSPVDYSKLFLNTN